MFDLAESMMSFMKQSIETNIGKTLIIASTLLEGTVALANGRATELLMAFIIFSEQLSREKFEIVAVNEWELLRFYLSVREAADTPNICIINLRRRTDRKNSILAQAMKEKLMVRLAVASLHPESKPSDDSYHGGCYAFDGSGRMVDAHRQLLADIGGTSMLNSLVHVQWRPNDLKPFDRDAPSDESLVRMSETEVACALSHIASWKGALRSLQLDNHQNADKNRTPNNLFDYPLHTLRSLRIGGFARGPALLYQNTHMSPAPVMIILEDDAILVDRFRERLDELLEELPRDFHFCSIGFSRPKSAPIVQYGKHCGVPTHVFYLTGYLLSAAGAEYLLNQLPVVGPVDSFIGLKMTSNWANVFGEHVGVGIQSKPIADPVAKKDMARILSFRAFCALEPLCSQRVGTVTAAAASVTGRGLAGRAWRQRDTDVQYSGDRRGSFRKERPSR
jgi:GR25 family glycosyltransferase involved in LPS biosynthesis